MEIIPIVNELDRVIGSVEKENFDKSTGQIYRTAGLFLLDKSGRILIQRRALTKNSYAGEWDITSAAGHVAYGETYLEAILREVEEELGLRLDSAHFLGKRFGEYPGNRRRFTAIFVAVADFGLSDLRVLKDEVDEVRLVSFSELGEMMRSGEMKFTRYSVENLADYQGQISQFLKK